MNKEDIKLHQKVKYLHLELKDVLPINQQGDKNCFESKEYIGEIVGIGTEGIIVEFGENFDGHDGLVFPENGEAIHENNHHWYFDFEEGSYEKSILIDELELIE